MAPKKSRKVRVDLTVDPDKRAIFDSLFSLHGLTLSDLVGKAMDDVIGDVAPDILLEMRIEEKEIELAEMKGNLIEARFISKQMKLKKEAEAAISNVRTDLDERLDSFRLEKYEATKDSLAYQYKNRTIDWNRIKEVFEFKNKDDAMGYIKCKLSLDNLINYI